MRLKRESTFITPLHMWDSRLYSPYPKQRLGADIVGSEDHVLGGEQSRMRVNDVVRPVPFEQFANLPRCQLGQLNDVHTGSYTGQFRRVTSRRHACACAPHWTGLDSNAVPLEDLQQCVKASGRAAKHVS